MYFVAGLLTATAAIIAVEIKLNYSLGDKFKDYVLVPLHLAKKDAA